MILFGHIAFTVSTLFAVFIPHPLTLRRFRALSPDRRKSRAIFVPDMKPHLQLWPGSERPLQPAQSAKERAYHILQFFLRTGEAVHNAAGAPNLPSAIFPEALLG